MRQRKSRFGNRFAAFHISATTEIGSAAKVRFHPVTANAIDAPFLRFMSKGIGAQEFFTFLLPNDGAFAAPQVFETEVSGGRAFVIKYRDYRDIFVFTDGEQIVHTELFNTNFRFLWARLSEGRRFARRICSDRRQTFQFRRQRNYQSSAGSGICHCQTFGQSSQCSDIGKCFQRFHSAENFYKLYFEK